jgi:hypothetical protein
MVSTTRRATGNMPGLIPLAALDLELPIISNGSIPAAHGAVGDGMVLESGAGRCASGTCNCR